jgi:hypothetical protein
VVVSVDFRVDVESPIGVTVTPLEVDPVVFVWTPLMLELRWLVVSTVVAGAGTTGAVVVCVVVELEDEDCARAAPVSNPKVNVAASKDLIMSGSPGNWPSGDRSLCIRLCEAC